ncbi:hypothetical protein C1H76_7888 [Elsinoe australis]|uniref:HMG box domain-containing protein n=1 Tax=Elsinoe australis TaxID=40998 RepID=A0A4U7AWC9_9PEZI|nr:hypothetical protein C1H76_7888 [Elsinoe australis]
MLPTQLPLRLVAATRLTTSTTFVARSLLTRRVLVPSFTRLYATPAKPKKGSIGETAKRGRTTKTTSTTGAKPKTTTRKATTKTKAPAKAKQPSKTATLKAAAKQRAVERAAKSKAKKAEQAAKKREREKQKRAKAKAQTTSSGLTVKELKAQALAPPKVASSSAWIVFYAGRVRNNPSAVRGAGGVTQVVKDVKREYDNLSSSEKESYERRAKEEKADSEREYKRWVEGHGAEDIRKANVARAQLRRLKIRGAKQYKPIQDERALKKPISAYLRFNKERFQSGQHRGSVPEQAKESGRVWKELGDHEKKDYYEAYEKDLAAYNREYEALYGHPAPKKAATTPKAKTTT